MCKDEAGNKGTLPSGMQSEEKQRRMRLEKRWGPDHAKCGR